MGTNYNAIYDKCGRCGRSEQIHIGKLSGGWEFMFRAHCEPQLESVADRRRWLKESGAEVRSEYGDSLSGDDFWALIERSRGKKNHVDFMENEYPHRDRPISRDDYKDPEGWSFSRNDFS